MGSGWIGMSEGSIGGGCEIGRVVAEDLRIDPIGSQPAEGPGSEGVRVTVAREGVERRVTDCALPDFGRFEAPQVAAESCHVLRAVPYLRQDRL
jgi:hypothetical protein